MTDKEYAKQKARIKKIIEKWHDVFELGQWDIVFYWTRVLNEDNPRVKAQVKGDWQYRHCTMELFLPMFEDNDDIEAERTIIHELTHVLLLPMAAKLDDDGADNHEYTCVSLTRAIIRAYQTSIDVQRHGK